MAETAVTGACVFTDAPTASATPPVAAGLAEPREHALISLLAVNGLRVTRADD